MACSRDVAQAASSAAARQGFAKEPEGFRAAERGAALRRYVWSDAEWDGSEILPKIWGTTHVE